MTGPNREVLEAARAYTRRIYGSALAEKASDNFCAAVLRREMARGSSTLAFSVRESTGFGAFAEASFLRPVVGALPGPPLASVVEFEPPRALVPATPEQRGAKKRSAKPSDRAARVHAVRTANYRAMSSVYDEIERLSVSAVGVAPELTGVPQIQSLITQVCWLNRTVRTWAGPEALADVTADNSVTRVDVPRPLTAEANMANHKAIGLPGFLAATAMTGEGITVGVIDSEVALRHPALLDRVTHRRNYTPEPWGNPDVHGTAIAGIIGSRDDNVPGIAPDVEIYNYKVLATNSFLNGDDIAGAVAIQQALEDGVDVVNCSWGTGRVTATKSREAIAVDAAWALGGMVVVKSAGNIGPGASTVTTPADADGVIVVGATALDGKAVESYSSRGPANSQPRPHLVAPGGGHGGRLTCCLVSGGFGDAGDGTSYAAPHVTGAVALLLQQTPGATPDAIRSALLDAARKLSTGSRNVQGQGLLELPSP
jgi:serine protease AprX